MKKELTSIERLALIPNSVKAKLMFLIKKHQNLEVINQGNPEYLTEAHKKNSESARKYITESKKSLIDWEKQY